MKVGEVSALGKPVVHLRVDVDGVLRSPRRIDRLVPDALKIRGKRTRARAGDEQVSAELKVDRQQMDIFTARLQCFHTLVCRRAGVRVRTEADLCASEVAL